MAGNFMTHIRTGLLPGSGVRDTKISKILSDNCPLFIAFITLYGKQLQSLQMFVLSTILSSSFA